MFSFFKKKPLTPLQPLPKNFPESEIIELNPTQLYLLEAHSPGITNGQGSVSSSQMKLLEKIIPGLNDPNVLVNRRKQSLSFSAYQVAAAQCAIWTRVAENRRRMIQQVDKLSCFYLVKTLTQALMEDALSPDTQTNKIMDISSSNPKIQNELEALDERFKFDKLLCDITPDLIKYGFYTLSTKVRNYQEPEEIGEESGDIDEELTDLNPVTKTRSLAGLLELNDTVDQTCVVAILKNQEVAYYLYYDEFEQQSKGFQISRKPKTDFVQFMLGHEKVRIDLLGEFRTNSYDVRKALEEFPRFVRIGESLIAPYIGKIKELMLLEQLVPASKLSKLSAGTILGVNVPAGYDVNAAMEACRQIEGVINKKVGIDKASGEITVESILATAGKVKCVPVFGNSTGSTQVLQTRSDEPDDLMNSTEQIRKLICDSIGVPYEIIYGGSSGEKRGELLKRYGRYLRKLKTIQNALVEGIYQIISIHLANKGILFTRKDINITFLNKLVEIDSLDKLEFTDTVVGMLSNIKGFITDLAAEGSILKDYVDAPKFADFLAEQFSAIGMEGVFRSSKDVKPEVTPPSSDLV